MPHLDPIETDHFYDVTYLNDKGLPVTSSLITNVRNCGNRNEMLAELSYLYRKPIIHYVCK